MSSKAENKLNHSHQQSRLNIFFRSPVLLKIVAWLGSLSFLGSSGLALADLKPISTSRTESPELIQANPSPLAGGIKLQERETYGPWLQAFASPAASIEPVKPEEQEIYGPLPIAQQPAPVQANLAQLPNREVPVAVAPASAVILPTGTIVRPPHTDLASADNYTVGVNESTSKPQTAEEIADISVPTPTIGTMPGRSRDIISTTKSQVKPSYIKLNSVVNQSVPTTSLQAKSKSAQSVSNYRSVPAVASLPVNSTPQRVGKAGASLPTSVSNAPTLLKGILRQSFSAQVVPLAGLRSTVVTPMKPSVMAQAEPPAEIKSVITVASTPIAAAESIEILVPPPRTGRIEVPSVAHLPQISDLKSVPTVPAIPSVRPAAMNSQSQPVAFTDMGVNESRLELGYPLSNAAPVTSRFGWRTHPITGSRRFHSGVDIGAPMGASVVAAGTGIIVSSGWLGGYGRAIVIQHNGVQQTLYGHLSEVFVQPGQRIEQGTVIGRVGSSGNSTGPHLHFEARSATADGWVAVDPGDEIKYALENLHRSAPFAQRELPPGYN